MAIQIEINKDDLIKKLDDYKKNVVEKAIVRSLNRTLASLKTLANSNTRDVIRLKLKDVADRLTTVDATSSTSYAALTIKDTPVPLILYTSGSAQKKSGVRINVKGTSRVVANAFIATMRSGHEGVFKRVGAKRLPIEELFSTSVRDVFKDNNKVTQLIEAGRDKFKTEFASNLKFYGD